MSVRSLLVESGNEKRIADFDRYAHLHARLWHAQKSGATVSKELLGPYAVTGTVSFVQYLIGGVIEGSFLFLDGEGAVNFSSTVWGPGVGVGKVKGAGAFTVSLAQLPQTATIYVATEGCLLEIAWFDEQDHIVGFFGGTVEGISVGTQVANGTFSPSDADVANLCSFLAME